MKPPILALAFGLLFAPAAIAVPLPSGGGTSAVPVLTVQAKSLDQLHDAFKTMAKNFFDEAVNERFEQKFLSKFDGKALKGIDTKKPVGLYGVVGAGLLGGDFAKSSMVIFVPVTNENDFIALLGNIELKPEKKGDSWSISWPTPIPDSPIQATIWFRKGYAHISLGTEKPELKAPLDPSDVISDKETAAIAIHLRVDRLPEDFKTESLALLTQRGEEAEREMKGRDFLPPEVGELVAQFFRISSRWLKSVTGELKELVVRVDLDPKTGLLIVDKTLEAKQGTDLARSFAALKPTKNDFANIIGADSAAHILIQAPLFVNDVRDLLAGYVDLGPVMIERQKARNNEPKELIDLLVESLHTLNRTLKSGDMDFAASLRGPDKNDQYTAVGAIRAKDTAALEKAMKAGLKVAPKDVAEKFKFDVFKVDAINVHEITVADDLPPEAQKVFGKSSVYFAFGPNAGFITFGAQGKEAIKELLTAKHAPKPAPLANFEISGKRMAALLKGAGAPTDGATGHFFQTLVKLDRIPVGSVKVEGGDRLVVRTEFNLLIVFAGMNFD
jgi:hypothetical protein